MLDGGAIRIADVERVALEDNFWVASETVDLNPQVLGINKLVSPSSSILFAFDVSPVLAKLHDLSAGLLVMSAVREIDGGFLQLPFSIKCPDYPLMSSR
jgi:hypothetical protein